MECYNRITNSDKDGQTAFPGGLGAIRLFQCLGGVFYGNVPWNNRPGTSNRGLFWTGCTCNRRESPNRIPRA